MIVEDDEILEYLEHHGVKGMRWGVRSARSGGSSSNSRKKLTKADKIALGALGVTGALLARKIMSNKGRTKFSDLIASQ